MKLAIIKLHNVILGEREMTPTEIHNAELAGFTIVIVKKGE